MIAPTALIGATSPRIGCVTSARSNWARWHTSAQLVELFSVARSPPGVDGRRSATWSATGPLGVVGLPHVVRTGLLPPADQVVDLLVGPSSLPAWAHPTE